MLVGENMNRRLGFSSGLRDPPKFFLWAFFFFFLVPFLLLLESVDSVQG